MRSFAIILLAIAPAFAGDLTARYNLTLRRVLDGSSPKFDDEFILADLIPTNTRRFTNFSGDVSGRYIGALASAASYSGSSFPALDHIVTEAIRLQAPDGHFGAPMSTGKVVNSDMATLWGNGRLLIGLLEYYRLTHRPDVLSSARELGDFLVTIAPRLNAPEVQAEYNGAKFAVGYICWTQNLEGIVELYRQTHEDRFLKLARELAQRVDRHESQHSHGYLSAVRGVLELHRLTRDPQYLEQAKKEWNSVIASGNLLAPGTVPEMFAPAIKRDEGCSEADWLRLTLDLWQVTRDPVYLDQAERALFNEFAFNQFASGDFGHHTLTSTGFAPPTARAWWCCTFHGLRALAAVFAATFRDSDGVLLYDLPIDGSTSTDGLTVRAESTLQRDAKATLTIEQPGSGKRSLGVRLPAWATAVTLELAGKPLPLETHDGFVSVSRQWAAGDCVTVSYLLRTRTESDPKQATRVAVFHGPWLLAVDEVSSPNYFDEPSQQNQVRFRAQNAGAQLKAAPTAGPAGPFAVPIARFRFHYRPGGYPIQPASALLRPLAEYTSGPDLNRLDFWLPLVPETEKLDSNYNQ